MFNADFAKTDKTFIAACEAAGIPPTARQAGKFRRGDGVAYRVSSGSRAAARTAAEKMTCKALRAALVLKASDRTKKAELVAAYLAR